MAEFFGLEDLAMERTLLQQLRTELNSSANKRFFLFEGGSKLSFAALTISLSAAKGIRIAMIALFLILLKGVIT